MNESSDIKKPASKVLVIGGRGTGKTLHAAIELIEENTKLKAEVERLGAEVEHLKTLIPKICETCEHEDVIGWQEPCNSCLKKNTNGTNWKLKRKAEQ